MKIHCFASVMSAICTHELYQQSRYGLNNIDTWKPGSILGCIVVTVTKILRAIKYCHIRKYVWGVLKVTNLIICPRTRVGIFCR